MQNSVNVAQAVQDRLRQGTQFFVIDLERCPTMDSTFLGTLKSVAREVGKVDGGRVTVINVNTRNEQLLENLGLNYLLEVDLNGSSWVEERRIVASELAKCEQSQQLSKQEQALHVLDAHKVLCDDNAENESRFKDVIDFLERDLAKHD